MHENIIGKYYFLNNSHFLSCVSMTNGVNKNIELNNKKRLHSRATL